MAPFAGGRAGRNANIPVLGVNLGRIGFLAEAEGGRAIDGNSKHVVATGLPEDRLTLDVVNLRRAGASSTGWALSLGSVWKRPRLGDGVVVERSDGRPVSAFGCDGVLRCPRRPGQPPMHSRREAGMARPRSGGLLRSRAVWPADGHQPQATIAISKPTGMTRCSATVAAKC